MRWRWHALLTIGVFIWVSLGGAGAGSSPDGWLQYGGDAANSGTATSGPGLPEVAFRIDLPLGRSAYAAPLVSGRDAFVLTSTQPSEPVDDAEGVYRIGLDDGSVTHLLQAEGHPTAFAIDGDRIFMATDQGIFAHSLTGDASGTAIWAAPHPEVVAAHHRSTCPFVKIAAGVLYAACLSQGAAADNSVYGESGEYLSVLFVRAVNGQTGNVLWTWVKDAAGSFGQDDPSGGALAPSGSPFVTYVNGLAVIGPYVVITGIDGIGDGGFAEAYAWALDARDGSHLWRLGSSEAKAVSDGDTSLVRQAAEPTGTPTSVFLKLDDLVAVNPARSTEIWRKRLGAADSEAAQNMGTGLALDGPALFAASRETLYRFAADGREDGWSTTLDPAWGHVYTSTHLHVADDIVYARSRAADNLSRHAFHAFDATNGARLWAVDLWHEGAALADLQFMTAVGPDVVVAAGMDGSVHVIGRTEASRQIHPTIDTIYPQVGTPLSIRGDASTSGDRSSFSGWRLVLPGGTTTEWQTSPELNHTFAAAGPHTLIVQARNEAGQIAAHAFEVHVGGEPPVEPTLLGLLLARENQDVVWGVAGILVALMGAAFAVWGRRRRRRALERELAALDGLMLEHAQDPHAWHAAVAERRLHIQEALLRGRLDEAQVAVLEQRIMLLGHDASRRALDERLGFLPHRVVMRLRAALRDGRISQDERQTFDEEVLASEALGEEERQALRHFLDEWTA